MIYEPPICVLYVIWSQCLIHTFSMSCNLS